ncbi:hypothetical protein D3C81_920850 [compost metagenome]
MPDIITITSRRDSVSRGLLACAVVNEPSWPVFIACSMSSASPPRHSPTTMRSGRMRRAFFTRSRMVIWPLPSMFGGRASSATRLGWTRRNSAASSMVTTRSLSGMKLDRMLSSVVLPEPVPPLTTMFRRSLTAMIRNSSIGGFSEPNVSRSSPCSLRLENLRMLMLGPRNATGGMIALTREPSFKRASTIGELSSMRRPSGVTMRSMADNTARSLVKLTVDCSMRPARSMKIWSWALTMISVTLLSSSRSSSGPRPMASSSTSLANRRRLMVLGRSLNSFSITPSISLIVVERRMSSDMPRTSTRRRSICLTSAACTRARHTVASTASSSGFASDCDVGLASLMGSFAGAGASVTIDGTSCARVSGGSSSITCRR